MVQKTFANLKANFFLTEKSNQRTLLLWQQKKGWSSSPEVSALKRTVEIAPKNNLN
jgi:hypothetical protein